MTSIAELVDQLKQATAGRQSLAAGGPVVTFSDMALKPDQDSASDDRASTNSGSRSMESTCEVQSSKAVNDELVSRLMFENAKLTRRMDEIESNLSGKLVKRVDELEKGVSVVIHDLLSLRRHVESNVDPKLNATMQKEEAASKFQKLDEAVHGLTVDLSTCKNVLNNFFGVNQMPSALATGANDSKSAARNPAEAALTNQRAVQEVSSMAKTAPVTLNALPSTPQLCNRATSRPVFSSRVASQQASQQPSQQASPVQSKFGSKCASPVRNIDLPYNAGAADRRASPVRFNEQGVPSPPNGIMRCEARLHERRASPDAPRPIAGEDDSVHCEAQLLDRMIAESEKTLGKIKMIAESKGLAVNAVPGSEGQGSMSLPRGSLPPSRTDDKGMPVMPRRVYNQQSASVPSASPAMHRSRPMSMASTPMLKSPM